MTFKLCSLLLAVAIVHVSWAQTVNYCDLDLCYGDSGHIACDNDGQFHVNCSADARIVPIKEEWRVSILREHNEYRNKIAAGFGNFKPAARMASMQWDDELAALAELRSRKCNEEHDICRNTDSYHYAGQNIAINYFFGFNKIDVPSNVIKQIGLWFKQHEHASMDVINNFQDPAEGAEDYRAFTGMMQEKAHRVGCAIYQQTGSAGLVQHAMTCNYSFTNIEGLPVYTVGRTASQCKTGTNVRFTSLCKVAEEYDVNELPVPDDSANVVIN